MIKEKIIVLGASGSIGLQTLDLLINNPNFELVGITFKSRYENIEPYLNFFSSLKFIGIVDSEKGEIIKAKFGFKYSYAFGDDVNEIALNILNYDSVVNAIMGNAGLIPTIKSLEKGKILYLANKESLIIGGKFVLEALNNNKNAKLFPIDSEHVGLNKLINLASKNNLSIYQYGITASGGALRNYSREQLSYVSINEVLAHPTWSMGAKITVDSATMVNKAYEIVEASLLFNIPISSISALICLESTLHAFIKVGDKTYYDYSINDMHESIKFALSHGKIESTYLKDDDKLLNDFHLMDIDYDKFPLFNFILDSYKNKGNFILAVINTIDEMAISYFLNGKISYLDIEKAIINISLLYKDLKIVKIEQVLSLIEEVKVKIKLYLDKISN